MSCRASVTHHRKVVLAKTGGRCTYCGSPGQRQFDEMWGWRFHLEIDHFVPRARGGTNRLKNLWPACPPCNSSKGAKLYSEWVQ